MKLPVTLGAAVLYALAAVTQLSAQSSFSYRGLYEATLTDGTIAYLYVRKDGDGRFARFDFVKHAVMHGRFTVTPSGTFALQIGTVPIAGDLSSGNAVGTIGALAFNIPRYDLLVGANGDLQGLYEGWFLLNGGTVLDGEIVFSPSGRLFLVAQQNAQTGGFFPTLGCVGIYADDGSFTCNEATEMSGVVNPVHGSVVLTDGTLDGTFIAGNMNRSYFKTAKSDKVYRLANISTRGKVGTGADVMIAGFIIKNGAKRVMVRAIAPSLGGPPFNVPGVLANPKMELHSATALIASNDDWQTGNDVAAIQATGLAPGNNLESALLVSLEEGPYTVIVSGVGGGTGVALVEVYEID